MKSLEELARIREQTKAKIALREKEGAVRVVVGMATCGIAAGARPVLSTFVEGLPNMKKNTDEMEIETEVGVGTTIHMKVYVA